MSADMSNRQRSLGKKQGKLELRFLQTEPRELWQKKGKLVKGENRIKQNKWVKIVQQRKKTTASPTVEPWSSSFGKVIIFKAFSPEILPIDAII